MRCSSRSGAMQTAGPDETRCGRRRRLLCGPLRRRRLRKCTSPRLGADRDCRHIARDFDHTVYRLVARAIGVLGFAECARAYKQRRKSNPQQVEIVRWPLLVSCLGETESSTAFAWRRPKFQGVLMTALSVVEGSSATRRKVVPRKRRGSSSLTKSASVATGSGELYSGARSENPRQSLNGG